MNPAIFRQVPGILLATVSISLAAQVAVPLAGGVPFTLQTLAILLSAWWLGPVRGVAAVGLYLFLGGIGLPVFSDGGSGWERFVSPSGGFLLGFLMGAILVGWGAKKQVAAGFWRTWAWFMAGHGVILIAGVLGMSLLGTPGVKLMTVLFSLTPGVFIKSLLGSGLIWALSKVKA